MYPLEIPRWQPTPPVLEPKVRTKVTWLLELYRFSVRWIEQSDSRKRSRDDHTRGVPDIVAVHPIVGEVWVEVKGIGTGHEATSAQLTFQTLWVLGGCQVIIGHNNIESLGGYTEVCDALRSWGLAK